MKIKFNSLSLEMAGDSKQTKQVMEFEEWRLSTSGSAANLDCRDERTRRDLCLPVSPSFAIAHLALLPPACAKIST
jgi:hypothetical protein